jgi:uncharacterized protein (DUF1330 family)
MTSPTDAQLAALAGLDTGGPVTMLNLLRFAPEAGDGSGRPGRDVYMEYGAAVIPMVEALGGRVVWYGAGLMTCIGPEAEQWDEVVLVEYPSARAAHDMFTSAEYAAINPLRIAGLADMRLVAMAGAVVG